MKDIRHIPFDSLADPAIDNAEFIDRYDLRRSDWWHTQLLAEIGKYKFYPNGLEFLEHNIKTDRDRGIYSLLNETNRSLLVLKQTEHPIMSAAVPLYMAAQKMYNDIPYSKWDRDTLQALVPDKLHEAMICSPPQLTVERKLELLSKCMVKAGKPVNTASVYGVYHTANTELHNIPVYAKMMLLQTWVFHPSHRNKYMILDPTDWDNIPSPLIPVSVIEPVTKQNPQYSFGKRKS